MSTRVIPRKLRLPHSSLLHKIMQFLKGNAVMCIAFMAAAITSIIVPVDREYLGYIDFKTISCLYSVLAVVCALKNIRFFYTLAQKIVELFKNIRFCVLYF